MDADRHKKKGNKRVPDQHSQLILHKHTPIMLALKSDPWTHQTHTG